MVMSIHVAEAEGQRCECVFSFQKVLHSSGCRVEWLCPFLSLPTIMVMFIHVVETVVRTDKNAYLLLGKSYPHTLCRLECAFSFWKVLPALRRPTGMDMSILVLMFIHVRKLGYTVSARWVNTQRKPVECQVSLFLSHHDNNDYFHSCPLIVCTQ